MSRPDDLRQLVEMAKKARRLALATTDPITCDILQNYALECEEQAARLALGGTLPREHSPDSESGHDQEGDGRDDDDPSRTG